METQYITTKVPKGSEAFVFGSALSVENPNDFDLLIVYDNNYCSASNAYSYHQDLVDAIEARYKLPVHMIPLSKHELKSTKFVEKSRAVPIEEALKELTNKSSGRKKRAAY